MEKREFTTTETVVYAIGIICGFIEFMFWLATHVEHQAMAIPFFIGLFCLLYYLQHK